MESDLRHKRDLYRRMPQKFEDTKSSGFVYIDPESPEIMKLGNHEKMSL